MDISPSNMRELFTGFKTSFNKGFNNVKPYWPSIGMKVTSGTAAETYGWLGDFPGIREWLGDRLINELSGHRYRIVNRDFEETVAVKRNSIKDDQYGIYGPMMEKLGHNAALFPDVLIFGLLALGHDTPCFDGQYFFDTDHPVRVKGVETSVSNYEAGTGAPWYLIDGSQPLKPMIYQEREAFRFVSLDNDNDETVFMKNLFVYGSAGRMNVGFGLWQLAHMSRADLTAESYDAARVKMQKLRSEAGNPLGIRPTHLIVPPELEGTARRLLEAEAKTGGESNIWAKTAEIVVSPYL